MGKVLKNLMLKFLSLTLVFILTATMVNPITVEAKVKKKTLKSLQSFSNDDPVFLDSVAYKVGRGHYRFKISKRTSSGAYAFIKFMAPADKDYSFTVNNVHANKKKNYANGYFNILQKFQQTDGIAYTNTIAYSNIFGTRNYALSRKKRRVVLSCHRGNVFYIEFYVSSNKSKYVQLDFTIK
ncbi:hypothetical protein [Butyrivibrio sp. WCE2006]|uniref:hypothetical protein n=1 Tax=Butyrivibrio sp. WCE2006 TaxID=1410611 RepID=UPI0005D1FBED|nr:hypothetical protein [Butyrivibrio sp. WCE2006]